MNLLIKRLSGEVYSFSDIGEVLDFQVDAPSPKHYFEGIEGADGHIDLGTVYEGRTMRAELQFYALNGSDYAFVRNTIFKMFSSKEAFYLIDEREPTKQWLVKCASKYTPEQLMATFGTLTIEFVSKSAFAVSTTTTLESNSASNTKNTAAFTITNPGDETIDPRMDALVITYTGASTNLKIKNNTTGEEWQYTGTSAAADKVVLDGIRALKNGLSIYRDTNRKLIRLVPGNNSFTLTGASGSFSISFDFRYKYL